jgi:hypothetical protein
MCEVSGGVARLSGVVPSFYLKAVAQAALLSLTDLKGVANRVEVRPTAEWGDFDFRPCGEPPHGCS